METLPKFLTAYSQRKRHYAPHGSREENTYGYEVNKKGEKKLVITGKTNVYAKIQEYAEDCKIENILARVAAGDMSSFHPQAIYSDMSEMPKNLIEAQQAIQKLENTWNTLPSEIRAKFNNDLNQFAATAGEETWMVNMGLVTETMPTKNEVSAKSANEKGEQNNES